MTRKRVQGELGEEGSAPANGPLGPVRRRGRMAVRGGLVALATVVVTLGLLELGLRLFRPVPYAIEQNMFFEPDPYTGYRLRPGSAGSFNDIPARVNELGMRDDPVAPEKPPDVRRILVLGDSFTVGASVAPANVWPQVLEGLLGGAGVRLEVLNAAVGGWGPFQYEQEFKHRGRALAPDAVLVGFFVGNDAYDQRQEFAALPTAVLGRRVSRAAATRPWIGLEVFLNEHFHLARFLRFRGATRMRIPREHCDEFSPRLLEVTRERLVDLERDHLLAARQLLRQNVQHLVRIQHLAGRAPVVVVLIPSEVQVNPALRSAALPPEDPEGRRYDFEAPQAELRALCESAGLRVVDLLEPFRADPRCLYLNDTHCSPAGHALIARVVAEHLAQAAFWRR